MKRFWVACGLVSLAGSLSSRAVPAAPLVPTYGYVGYGEKVNSAFDGARGKIQMKDSDNVTAAAGASVWCAMGTCDVFIEDREWVQAGWYQKPDSTKWVYGEVKVEYGLSSDIRDFDSQGLGFPLPAEGLYKCRKNGTVYECIVDGFVMNSTAVVNIEEPLCSAVFAAEIQDTQDHVPGSDTNRVKFSECQVRYKNRPVGTGYVDGDVTQPLNSASVYGAAKSPVTLAPAVGWTFEVWDTRNQP